MLGREGESKSFVYGAIGPQYEHTQKAKRNNVFYLISTVRSVHFPDWLLLPRYHNVGW